MEFFLRQRKTETTAGLHKPEEAALLPLEDAALDEAAEADPDEAAAEEDDPEEGDDEPPVLAEEEGRSRWSLLPLTLRNGVLRR